MGKPVTLPATVYAVVLMGQTPDGSVARTYMFAVSGRNPLTEAEAIERARDESGHRGEMGASVSYLIVA